MTHHRTLHHFNKKKKKILIRTGLYLVTITFLMWLHIRFGETVSNSATMVATFLHLSEFVNEMKG